MSDYCPKGWGRIKLGEIGKFSTSSVDKKRVASELPVRLLNYMDVYRNCFLDSSMTFMEVTAAPQEVQRARVLKGDMFFTPSSETPDDIGRSAVFLDEPANLLHSYHTVRYRIYDNSRVDLRFRGLMANSAPVLKHYSLLATGSTRYTLSLADFESTSLCLPPLGEQRRIVEILEALDTAIHETEAIIAKLKAVKQGLLHDLLTRGIDANGELRPPQAEAPHLYKQSPLGWIPKEWDAGTIGSYLDGEQGIKPGPFGSSIKKEAYSESGFKVYGQEQVIAGDQEIGSYFVPLRKFQELQDFAVEVGDVLISLVGTIGKVLVLKDPLELGIINPRLMRLRPDSRIAHSEFVGLLVSSNAFVSQVIANAGGGTMPVINKRIISSIRVPVVPLKEQQEILKRKNTVDQRISCEFSALEKLRALKSGLMDDLLTGRVRVTPLLQEAQHA